jgi:hypothetical protein
MPVHLHELLRKANDLPLLSTFLESRRKKRQAPPFMTTTSGSAGLKLYKKWYLMLTEAERQKCAKLLRAGGGKQTPQQFTAFTKSWKDWNLNDLLAYLGLSSG